MIRFLVLLTLTAALFQCTDECIAQSEFETMCQSWSELDAQMTEKLAALNDGDTTPGLAEEYRDLVDQAKKLIDSMRDQGVKELKTNASGKTIRALLGIMIHDAQDGRDGSVLKVGQELISARINPKYFELAAKSDRLDSGDQSRIFEELLVRHKESVADDLPRIKLETSAGEIVLELFENEAPNTVSNFVTLVESGFYNNRLFHRVVEGFVAQGGGFESEDEIGVAPGGPGYQIPCECKNPDARLNYTHTISMAHIGRPDTGGSQFFLNFGHNSHLDRKHTVFGRVVSGFETLDKIERTMVIINGNNRKIEKAKPDRIITAKVLRKRDHVYRVRKVGDPEASTEDSSNKNEDSDTDAKAKSDKEETSEKDKDGQEPDPDDDSQPEDSDEGESDDSDIDNGDS